MTAKQISDLHEQVRKQLEEFGNRRELRTDYKADQVRKLRVETLAKIEELKRQALGGLEERRKQVTPLAAPSVTPPIEEVTQLEYTRAALGERWKNMSSSDMRSDWQAALERGDKVTARVYRDFGKDVLRGKTAKEPVNSGSNLPAEVALHLVERASDLATKTNDMLMSAEQRTAIEELQSLDDKILEVHRAATRAQVELEGTSLKEDGTLAFGDARSEQLNVIRSAF